MTSTSPERPDDSAGRTSADGDSVLSGDSSNGNAVGSDAYSPSATASGSEADASGIASPGTPAAPYAAPTGASGGYSPPPSDPYTAPPAYGQTGQSPQGGYGQGYQQPPAGYPGQQPAYPPQGAYQPPPAGGYQQPTAGYDPQAGGQPAGQYAPPPAYPNQPGYPPQPYAGQPAAGPQPMSQSDERLWATLSHISIPFIGVVGPLIVYLVFKDRSAFLKDQGTESLNFSILYTIAQVVASFLVFAVVGGILLPLIFIGALVLCIIAAIAANKGEAYRYPINWRLIK